MQKEIVQKVIKTIREDGAKGCLRKTESYINKKIRQRKLNTLSYKDILFISGCREDLPHPWRYRVKHQREQLEAYHYATDEVYYQDLKLEQLNYYRAFIFFRCPCTDLINEFVDKAKKLNKKVAYDVDDLVIDTFYTNQIKFVQEMGVADKVAYDNNVLNMQKLLKKCDFAITSTNCLAEELKKYVPFVYINRNTASEEMVKLSKEAIKIKEESQIVKLGYFSGSITHNADFEMILPIIITLMERHENIELYLVGELDLPDGLQKYSGRIKKLPFGDWRHLPQIISLVDINLAPLENTIFNKAKSENKWVEAALVKTVTVASDVGAFHDCIENKKTGFLCSSTEEWETTLNYLIEHKEERDKVAEYAQKHCLENNTTINTGKNIVKIFKEALPSNYVFVLPGLEISGGIKVALKHAKILQDNGKDVTLFLLTGNKHSFEFEGTEFPIINIDETKIKGNIGYAVATMWTTMAFVDSYINIKNRCYLVQNYESNFYEEGNRLRIEANKSYCPYHNVKFYTISKWCEKWLKEQYNQNAIYAPNGIEIERFTCHKRSFGKKIRILIEGDCAVDYKNVDEAFEVINKLDSASYEVWYMSYNAEPKEKYRVDKFLHKIPYEKVPEIYAQCDILLKTSLLESFSYPPLEMMASGGYVVAVPNGGNVEYLQHGENCLFYEAGNIAQACDAIRRIKQDKELQETLFVNGRKTAESRAWENINQTILKMYTE